MNAASLIQAVSDRFPAAVTASHSFRGDATAIVSRDSLLEIARSLKEDAAFQMNFLMDLTAVDFSGFGTKPSRGFFSSSGVGVHPSSEIPTHDPWPGPPADARFAVVYHFFSLPLKHRLRVEVLLQRGRSGSGFRDLAVGRRRLARARGVGHVRDPLPGTPQPEAHPHV